MNQRGFTELNEFIEMLPLDAPTYATLRYMDRLDPERNYSAIVYEPHVEKLLAKKKAMTQSQWRDLVSRRRIDNDDDWVNKKYIIFKELGVNLIPLAAQSTQFKDEGKVYY